VKPKYFVPVHGEYRHLSLHSSLAQSVGIPKENIFVMEDGDVLELNQSNAKVTGRVNSSNVYVDGLSVGDIEQSSSATGRCFRGRHRRCHYRHQRADRQTGWQA
jgi:mRNA degradation ribonuclease J1/J2